MTSLPTPDETAALVQKGALDETTADQIAPDWRTRVQQIAKTITAPVGAFESSVRQGLSAIPGAGPVASVMAGMAGRELRGEGPGAYLVQAPQQPPAPATDDLPALEAPPRAAPPSRLRSGSLGGYEKQLGDERARFEGAQMDGTDQRVAMANQQKDDLRAAADLEITAINEQRRVREQLVTDQAVVNAKRSEMIGAYQKERSDGQAKLQEAMADARHFNMAPEDRRRDQATLADPNATPEQKAAAKASLRAGEEVDPSRVLGSAAAKVMVIIGSALQGYLQAFGINNGFGETVQQTIRNDLERQLANRASRREDVAGQRSLLEENRARFGDDLMGMDVTELQMLNAAKQQLEVYGSDVQTAEVKQRWAASSAELDERMLNVYERIQGNIHNGAVQTIGAQAQISSDRQRLALERDKANAQGGAPHQLPGLKRIAGAAPTKEMESNAAEIKGSGDAFRAAVERLQDIRKRAGVGGFEVANRELVAEGKSALADAKTAYIRYRQLGSLDKGAQEVADDVLGGDPTGTGFKDAKYATLIEAIDTTVSSKLKPLGFEVEQSAQRQADEKLGKYGGRVK